MSRSQDRVAGVVLAAGRSTRMGKPKALLTIGGDSFLARAIGTLRAGGCDPVIAVLPPRTETPEIWPIAEGADGVSIANPERGSEPIESIALAAERAPGDARALVILPVDHPLVTPESVARLLGSYRNGGARIVRPTDGSRAGHPILVDRALWDGFAPDLDEGLRTLVRRHQGELRDVPVDDPGIRIDIDTPADYAREIGAP